MKILLTILVVCVFIYIINNLLLKAELNNNPAMAVAISLGNNNVEKQLRKYTFPIGLSMLVGLIDLIIIIIIKIWF